MTSSALCCKAGISNKVSQAPLLKFQAFRHSHLRRLHVLSRPAHGASIGAIYKSQRHCDDRFLLSEAICPNRKTMIHSPKYHALKKIMIMMKASTTRAEQKNKFHIRQFAVQPKSRYETEGVQTVSLLGLLSVTTESDKIITSAIKSCQLFSIGLRLI
jgi:hypothetical protein